MLTLAPPFFADCCCSRLLEHMPRGGRPGGQGGDATSKNLQRLGGGKRDYEEGGSEKKWEEHSRFVEGEGSAGEGASLGL